MPDTKRGREEKGKNKREYRRRVLVERELAAPETEPDDLEAFLEEEEELDLSADESAADSD